jgi:hypothetical protein
VGELSLTAVGEGMRPVSRRLSSLVMPTLSPRGTLESLSWRVRDGRSGSYTCRLIRLPASSHSEGGWRRSSTPAASGFQALTCIIALDTSCEQ